MSDVEDSPEEELVPEKEEHLDINVYKQLKQTKQAKKQKDFDFKLKNAFAQYTDEIKKLKL